MSQRSSRSWLELAMVPKVSLGAKLAWLRAFGSPEAVLSQSVAALSEYSEEATKLAGTVDKAEIDAVFEWSSKTGGKSLFLGDDEYPAKLLERLSEPPLVLFARGDMRLLEKGMVAIVGTPKPTQVASARARTFALELAQEGVVVAAGLSPGIGGQALRGSMTSGEGVIGVVGASGAWDGRRITEDVAAAGLLVSEFAPGDDQAKLGYSRRHRLLPALARVLVVVEAPLGCDTIKLAGDAAHMGCEVAAVPSDPGNGQGRGCNMLLREGAALVEASADVIEAAGLPGGRR